MYDVVIIGGGPAGLTAAIYLARACYRVVVVEKEKFGGQITITESVVNYPGVERASGEELTAHMKRQGERFGAEFLLAEVEGIVASGDIKEVHTTQGVLKCFGILLATGAHPRVIGFEGEETYKGRGVAYCATCDGEFFRGKEVFVIGGGYAAAQESVFLTKYAKHITLLIREPDFTCAQSVADEARNNKKITVLTEVQVEKVEGDILLRSITYKSLSTGEVTTYQAKDGENIGVFVFAGYEPATDLVKDMLELDDQGYVITDRNQKTSIDGLYAAGDVCVKNLRQVVTSVGEGALAATELERYAAQLQTRTGIHPQGPQKKNDEVFSQDVQAQLKNVFEKMENPIILRLFLNETKLSQELQSYMDNLAHMTDKISLEIVEHKKVNGLPCVQVCRQDGQWSGLAFHGVPGGHEFSSFVMGLYQVAGPGQALEQNIKDRISQINKSIHIQVMVSLSCTMCPDLVIAAQKIAALNDNITADIYDISHFSNLQEMYQIMSVPCMVINDGKAHFGKKNISQILDIISGV